MRPRLRLYQYLVFLLLFALSKACFAGYTAEQVLGEYWKDPLFGEAATELTIYIDILSDRLWPGKIIVPPNKNIRFVFINKSDHPHLIAFSDNPEALLSDPDFTGFVQDELFHSTKKVVMGAGHNHASSNVNDAQAIVKTMSQRPTVFIVPDDQKEIMMRFDTGSPIQLFCAMDMHHLSGYLSEINIIESNE